MSTASLLEWRARTSYEFELRRSALSPAAYVCVGLAVSAPVAAAFFAAIEQSWRAAAPGLAVLVISMIVAVTIGVRGQSAVLTQPAKTPSRFDRWFTGAVVVVAIAAPLVAAARHAGWWLLDLPACLLAVTLLPPARVVRPTIPPKQRTSLA